MYSRNASNANKIYDLRSIAAALGGEVSGKQVRAPGPGHSSEDRSLSVTLNEQGDDIVVHSFATDDPIRCKDYVRERLGMPRWEPSKGNGHAKPNGASSPVVAEYVY